MGIRTALFSVISRVPHTGPGKEKMLIYLFIKNEGMMWKNGRKEEGARDGVRITDLAEPESYSGLLGGT